MLGSEHKGSLLHGIINRRLSPKLTLILTEGFLLNERNRDFATVVSSIGADYARNAVGTLEWVYSVKHGTRSRQNFRCFHFGWTCDVGSLGMAHLDAATPGTVEHGHEMLRRWIRLGLCFCRAGNWFRHLRAVPKLSL